MAFVDELQLHIAAGNGGDGVVRWRHEKFKEFGGPSGGDGGAGGDVLIRASRNLHGLEKYANVDRLVAGHGAAGAGGSKTGKRGTDLVLDFPVGTILTNRATGEVFELLKEGEQLLILRGGNGGFGNESFKSSTNQRPREWTPGTSGEQAIFDIELRLVADVGLIGLPSAGKSSLLNTLTNATAKTGAYHFTTLEPNLGMLHGYVLADIPGLIAGASTGKGLGHAFLRHIQRTTVLAHLVSFEYTEELGGEGMMQVYETIRTELSQYSRALADKPECIILSKKDLVDRELQLEKKALFEKLGKPVFLLSLYDGDAIKQVQDGLIAFLSETV